MNTSTLKLICFYSCFFGPTEAECNIINAVPSTEHDCYYYTNNYDTYKKLKATLWKPRFVPVCIKRDENINCFDSKLMKSCPHFIDELNEYEYTVYLDTSLMLNITVDELLKIIETKDKPMLLVPHRFWPLAKDAITVEYAKSMEMSRYTREKDRIVSYIHKKMQNSFSLSVPVHFETGFIIRKQNDPLTKEINEKWYEEIGECGIQCQISFGFVQQMFPERISPLNEPLDPFIVVQENYKNRTIQKIQHEGFTFWIN